MATHIYQLRTNCHSRSGHFSQNIFMYSVTESGTATPFGYADALITAWIAGVEADFLKIIGADVTLDFIDCKRVTGGGGPSASFIVDLASTAATDGSSNGLCADIMWITASANNRMGHTYIPAVPADGLAGDVYGGAYPGQVNTFIASMVTALTLPGALGSAEFGIYTRKTGILNVASDGQLRPKPTLLNKRTVPVL